MRQPTPISDYLDTLTSELSFDPPLARRVRLEVEDHLHEAAAGDASVEAQQRAVRAFGDAREIARQYTALSLLRQTRRTGAIVVLAVAGIYLTMKSRLAWYGLMQWMLTADLQDYGRLGLAINRCTFTLALLLGIAGWVYIGSRQVSATFHTAYRDQLRRGLAIAMAAACPLILSIVTDTVMTGLRLSSVQAGALALVPLLTIAAEMTLAILLVTEIYKTVRRAGRASSLLSS
jgi:hypothetical protein